MHRYLLFVFAFLCFCRLESAAQVPNLPTKGVLSETILSTRSFNQSTREDTVVKQRSIADNYTLEVVAKVNAATGRGLDMEARSAKMKGFRLSLDASALKWTSSLAASSALTTSSAGSEHTIRVAVQNQSAHIYQNGTFIQTLPLAEIKDIAGGLETDNLYNTVKSANQIPGWAGVAPNNTGKPSDYSWGYTGTTNTTLFAAANSTTAGTSRFMDVNGSSGGNLHTFNGSTYVGRVFFIRWDGSAIANTVYNFPMTLEANSTYDFSMLHAYVSNSTGSKDITVGIGKTTATTDRIASKVFTTSGTRDLKRESFVFTAQEAGTYYLTFTGSWGMFSVSDLSLNKLVAAPRFIFGKNYPNGAVDIEISSVTYEEGAFAPAVSTGGAVQNHFITDKVVYFKPAFNTNFIVPGQTDLHLSGEVTPLVNSTVQLNSNDAWLFFDHIRPSAVVANWLGKIFVNGVPAVRNQNVRVAIYKNGTVVIPNGNITSGRALEVFTQPNLAGETNSFAIETFHNNLGTFDNKIRSFKLHRGYMATLATGADGSGYSRVFIANDSDLVVNAMPQGLDTAVSFIRVFRWDWISKKGKAGWSPAKIGATWYYDWNIGGAAAQDYDYVIIRQNGGWPGWSTINSKANVNHLLGFNEPDRPDQANMTVDACVAQWPEMMKSGLRIGSPAPANPESSWITDFLAKTDALNYRVDFVAIHCYWGGQTPQQWYNRLKNIYNRVKRPLWITEWNNGANWTTESWPADEAGQFEKQLSDLKGILQVLDTASFVERYAIYDWVENKRAMVLADTLTPAGKYYFANKSDFAYSPQLASVPTWQLSAPALSSAIQSDDYFKVTVSWKDVNEGFGSKYILERKIDGKDADFLPLKEFAGYVMGSNLSFVDSVYALATYRVKAFNARGDNFVYSSILDVIRDPAPVAPPSLTGEVLSATRLQLNWTAGANVRSYNLKRSLSAGGPFVTVAGRITELQYLDSNLTPNTPYYYTVTTLNSAGESGPGTVLQLRTQSLVAPSTVKSPRIASGDARLILTWDLVYDVKYEISRASSASGPYSVIATNVDGVRYIDSLKTNGTTYYYKIVAINSAGRSAESAVLVGKPLAGQHLYIPFREGNGAVAEDMWGGYHGALAATAQRDMGYQNGPALKLDGAATSYTTLGTGLVSTLNDFTISTWVKVDALSNWMRIFDFGTGTSKYMFLTPQVSATGGISNVRYAIKNGGAEQQVNYSFTWLPNTWTHVAISQSGSTTSLYIDGALVASNTGMTIKPADLGLTNQNYIGKSQFPDPLFSGVVDEFKIFNYGLSTPQVQALYNLKEVKKTQTITFANLTQKVVGDADFAGGATASSGLTVGYTSSNTNVATIVGGMIRIVGAGSTTITAVQAGNDTTEAAPSVSRELMVKRSQAISFSALAAKAFGDADFDPGATASSGLPVSYTSSNTNVATIIGGKVRLVGVGSATITAAQEGDASFVAATAVGQSLTVADKKAPSQPLSLTAALTPAGKVGLAWQASTDDIGVTGYFIFLNGQPLNNTPVTTTSFIADLPVGNSQHAYTVKAVDAAGNLSEVSASVLFTNSNGAGNLSADFLSVAPNPSDGHFKVRLKDCGAGTVVMRLFNTVGVLVHTVGDGKLDGPFQYEFALPQLAKGIYILEVSFGTFHQNKIIAIH